MRLLRSFRRRSWPQDLKHLPEPRWVSRPVPRINPMMGLYNWASRGQSILRMDNPTWEPGLADELNRRPPTSWGSSPGTISGKDTEISADERTG